MQIPWLWPASLVPSPSAIFGDRFKQNLAIFCISPLQAEEAASLILRFSSLRAVRVKEELSQKGARSRREYLIT